MEFWNVYSKYEDLLLPEYKKDVLILQIIHEVDGLYQWMRNKELIDDLSIQTRVSFENVCMEIENIYHSKVIKFFVKEKTGLSLRYEMNMNEFDKSIGSFDYIAVQNRLIDIMRTGGIAVVISGSVGLTPQRLHGYVFHENNWSVCPRNILDMLRSIVIKTTKNISSIL